MKKMDQFMKWMPLGYVAFNFLMVSMLIIMKDPLGAIIVILCGILLFLFLILLELRDPKALEILITHKKNTDDQPGDLTKN